MKMCDPTCGIGSINIFYFKTIEKFLKLKSNNNI